jgi:uncharacterized membrane protein (UPF0127 family)
VSGPAIRIDGRRHVLDLLVADSVLSRTRGLLLRCPATMPDAALLTPCRAIHTFGMTAPIDVAFAAADGAVIQVFEQLPPWRCRVCAAAHSTWEFRAGLAAVLQIRPGVRLLLEIPR